MAFQKVVGNDIETPIGSRAEAATRAKGFITENFSLGAGNATGAACTDGTIFCALVGVKPGDVINNIHVAIETAGTGSGCTLAQYGLYDRLGNRVAVTTDNATARTATESTGLKTTALTAAYTVGQGTDGLWVAVINKNGTTVPNLIVSGTTDVIAASKLTGKFSAVATGGTSQTSLGATITPAFGSTVINFWAALS